jgi:hypothetical protein
MKAFASLWFATVGMALNVLAADPLPAWNDTAPKQALLAFVNQVTTEGGPHYVPPSERIAVFDNDGTLWCEQPMYVQLRFALDRVKALAPQHPEWKRQPPFKRLLSTPQDQRVAVTEAELMELLMATHAGLTTEAFEQIVRDWIDTARHPTTGRPYTDMVYQPMLELLAHLRANGFKTFIVSGGGMEFMRPWAERVYGVPPEQVIGSSIRTKYEVRDGQPVIVRLPAVNFIDDKAGKPVGIQHHIGRRPVLAGGNSDGDFEMLEWTTAGAGARLGLLVHHDDAEREFAYDRQSPVGRLNRGLDEGPRRGWILVSMKADWRRVYPADP